MQSPQLYTHITKAGEATSTVVGQEPYATSHKVSGKALVEEGHAVVPSSAWGTGVATLFYHQRKPRAVENPLGASVSFSVQ